MRVKIVKQNVHGDEPNSALVRVEHLSFADGSKRVTHRMAQYVYDLCKLMTVKDVAEHLDPKTVKKN